MEKLFMNMDSLPKSLNIEYDNLLKTSGFLLKIIRNFRDKSQTDVSEEIDKSQSVISSMEKGKKFDFKTFLSICQALDVSFISVLEQASKISSELSSGKRKQENFDQFIDILSTAFHRLEISSENKES